MLSHVNGTHGTLIILIPNSNQLVLKIILRRLATIPAATISLLRTRKPLLKHNRFHWYRVRKYCNGTSDDSNQLSTITLLSTRKPAATISLLHTRKPLLKHNWFHWYRVRKSCNGTGDDSNQPATITMLSTRKILFINNRFHWYRVRKSQRC